MAARGLGLSFIIVVCLRFSSPGAALWYSGALHQPWDNSMKAKVKWLDGVSFVAESGSGHAVVMDGAPEHGGRNIGPRPMEMLLMGLARSEERRGGKERRGGCCTRRGEN